MGRSRGAAVLVIGGGIGRDAADTLSRRFDCTGRAMGATTLGRDDARTWGAGRTGGLGCCCGISLDAADVTTAALKDVRP